MLARPTLTKRPDHAAAERPKKSGTTNGAVPIASGRTKAIANGKLKWLVTTKGSLAGSMMAESFVPHARKVGEKR